MRKQNSITAQINSLRLLNAFSEQIGEWESVNIEEISDRIEYTASKARSRLKKCRCMSKIVSGGSCMKCYTKIKRNTNVVQVRRSRHLEDPTMQAILILNSSDNEEQFPNNYSVQEKRSDLVISLPNHRTAS